jgi:hypothetical protein
LGALIAGERDGIFRNPFEGKERFGIFITWSDITLAYLFGSDNRFLVSKQFQLIPFIF